MSEETKTPATQSAETPQSVAQKKKKRVKRIRRIVILVIVAVLVVYGIASYVIYKNQPPVVTTTTVEVGDIEQVVSISGTVVTGEEKSYFAEVAVPIASLTVKVGDTVSAGDTLVTYDDSDLTLNKRTAQLKAQAADGDYSNSMEKDAQGTADYTEATARLEELDVQIESVQAQIDALNTKITEKKARMAATGAELQKALLDLTQGTDDYREVERSIQDNSYAQNNDSEIMGWNSQITDLNHQLENLKSEKSEMQSQKSTGKSAQLNSGAKSSLSANQQQTALSSQDTVNTVDSASQGVTADYNGVITAVNVKEGQTPTVGTELLHLASTDNVKVKVQITKADLDKIKVGQEADLTIAGNAYQGTVSKISGAATNNSNNVPVVDAEIDIENPDDAIILGVEAKAKIHCKKSESTVLLSYDVLNTDNSGDFVYVLNSDNVVERRDVKTGISNDTQVEITEGLTTEDQIITTLPAGVTEGTKVSTQAASAGLNLSLGKNSDASSETSTEASTEADIAVSSETATEASSEAE